MVLVNHNLIVHETQQSNFFVVKLLLLYRCSNARIRRIDAPLQDKMLAAMRDVPYVRIFCCEWLPLCMRKRTYLSHTTKIDWCSICVCDTHETPFLQTHSADTMPSNRECATNPNLLTPLSDHRRHYSQPKNMIGATNVVNDSFLFKPKKKLAREHCQPSGILPTF